MIKSENATTLCPRCVHFTKGIDAGCRIGNWGIEGPIAESIREWQTRQTDESSWTDTGPCPQFEDNGSSAQFMGEADRQALHQIRTKKATAPRPKAR